MAQIQGLAAHAAGAELLPFRYEPGDLGPHEVEIEISHCGICHSDLHLITNDWGISHYPFIPGHEIIGTVAAVGEAVRSLKVGSASASAGNRTPAANANGAPAAWKISARNRRPPACAAMADMPIACAPTSASSFPFPKPWKAKMPLPCYAAASPSTVPLRAHGINPSSRVGVIGIGGLGHLAVQFARVFGAEVTAFSTSAAKEEEARAMGAHHFVNTRETRALKEVAGTLDFILNTANADQDWSVYIQALRPTGTLCFVGVPPSPVTLHAFPLISGIRAITGSPIGSPSRIREMLDVAARHGVKAHTERFAMAKANEAIEKVKKNKVRYRAVLAN